MKGLVVLALATVVATVAVPAASAQTPAGDSVTGKICDLVFGSEPCELATFFEADARSGPSGENPAGTAAWGTRAGTQRFGDSGPVSCLAVSGNTAIVGFSGLRPFGRTLVRVIDGGGTPGADSFEAVTQASLGLVFAIPPPDCSSFPPGPAGDVEFGRSGVNELGDIVVIDGRPLPTTKEQCRNGGWNTFGVFKNQGDCVSFVATGGKNRPSG
jgi:hypothetical protein